MVIQNKKELAPVTVEHYLTKTQVNNIRKALHLKGVSDATVLKALCNSVGNKKIKLCQS